MKWKVMHWRPDAQGNQSSVGSSQASGSGPLQRSVKLRSMPSTSITSFFGLVFQEGDCALLDMAKVAQRHVLPRSLSSAPACNNPSHACANISLDPSSCEDEWIPHGGRTDCFWKSLAGFEATSAFVPYLFEFMPT